MRKLQEEIRKSKRLMGLLESEVKDPKKRVDDNDPYVQNIDKDTVGNNNYRKVVFTGKKLQLVLMSIPVGEEIGLETHKDGDQFFRIEEGEGEFIINGKTHKVSADFAFTIPMGSEHNIKNVGKTPLKLYTVYGPPQHEAGLIQKSKPVK